MCLAYWAFAMLWISASEAGNQPCNVRILLLYAACRSDDDPHLLVLMIDSTYVENQKSVERTFTT